MNVASRSSLCRLGLAKRTKHLGNTPDLKSENPCEHPICTCVFAIDQSHEASSSKCR